jgi:hypothetical protein
MLQSPVIPFRESLLTMGDKERGSEMGYWIILASISFVSTVLIGLLVSCLDPEKLVLLENLTLKRSCANSRASDMARCASATLPKLLATRDAFSTSTDNVNVIMCVSETLKGQFFEDHAGN